jgi:hypothetical protein
MHRAACGVWYVLTAYKYLFSEFESRLSLWRSQDDEDEELKKGQIRTQDACGLESSSSLPLYLLLFEFVLALEIFLSCSSPC